MDEKLVSILTTIYHRSCFEFYSKKFDNEEVSQGLDYDSFVEFFEDLCVDTNGEPHYIPQLYFTELFKQFDSKGDSVIDWEEFEKMWSPWLKTILRPRSAFIIVDVQNDFINGTLSVVRCPAGHRGEEVVPVINSLLTTVPFDLVVYSYDWHPNDHISFYENFRTRTIIGRNGYIFNDGTCTEVVNEDEEETKEVIDTIEDIKDAELADAIKPKPDVQDLNNLQVFETVTFEGPPRTDQKLWPRHCVQGSWGARLHPELLVTGRETIDVFKGTKSNIDSYSAFWDNGKLSETGLNSELKSRNITDVYVCGLAYDVCVGATSSHANEYGYRTVLVNDASRGVDCSDIAATKDRLINQSAMVVDSDRVGDMVMGRDRRPELAFRLAQTLI